MSAPAMLSPAHLERFRREAQAAARFQHPHIVPVFGFGVHQGTYYYAMQYVVGMSLDVAIDVLRRRRDVVKSLEPSDGSGPPSDDVIAASTLQFVDSHSSKPVGRRKFYREVARLGLQTAEALAYAHSHGILHRDIKPSNLLLDTKGDIWILDFGLALADSDDVLTCTGDLVGTLRYIAPERLDGWSDRRSDVYSLGVTLYELLTLRPFFRASSRGELLRQIAECKLGAAETS
jgi:eukaryotic-like serine/threonine-protein kinase